MEFETIGDDGEINNASSSFLLTASGVATAFNNNLYDNFTNWTLAEEDYLKSSPAVQVHIYILYVVIFVVGLLGNVLVVFVVAQNRAMQTVTNCFIANLALSDILLCVLAVPFTPLYFFLKEWIFGKILCHLVAYSQVSGVRIYKIRERVIAFDLADFVLAKGDVGVRFDADSDIHRHRSLLRHLVPVPAAHENGHLLDHDLRHLDGGSLRDASLRHLCRRQGDQQHGILRGELVRSVYLHTRFTTLTLTFLT